MRGRGEGRRGGGGGGEGRGGERREEGEGGGGPSGEGRGARAGETPRERRAGCTDGARDTAPAPRRRGDPPEAGPARQAHLGGGAEPRGGAARAGAWGAARREQPGRPRPPPSPSASATSTIVRPCRQQNLSSRPPGREPAPGTARRAGWRAAPGGTRRRGRRQAQRKTSVSDDGAPEASSTPCGAAPILDHYRRVVARRRARRRLRERSASSRTLHSTAVEAARREIGRADLALTWPSDEVPSRAAARPSGPTGLEACWGCREYGDTAPEAPRADSTTGGRRVMARSSWARPATAGAAADDATVGVRGASWK